MKILAIDTSCDETSVAVVENNKILKNIIWSQASAHAEFGGVMPTLAQRMHRERIDFVVKKALGKLNIKDDIDAIAVTIGPGLSIALAVGIDKAKELAIKFGKPLVPINHLEGHLFSANIKTNFPTLGLVISGGNTILVKINKVGSYEILAQTVDDALGEALDKAARMLGLGYPGGAILEKMARLGDVKKYKLPIPLVGQEERFIFSYSGLKASFMRKIAELKKINGDLSKQDIYDLSASFQNVAFEHLTRVIRHAISNFQFPISNFLIGGGVSANIEVRKRLRKLGKEFGIKVYFPASRKLYGDNAGMIGLVANLNPKYVSPDEIDRKPSLKF